MPIAGTIATRISAATSIRFMEPNTPARANVAPAPAIVPMLAPLAMKANSRGACALLNTSAIRLQKTETWKSENTLIQT